MATKYVLSVIVFKKDFYNAVLGFVPLLYDSYYRE